MNALSLSLSDFLAVSVGVKNTLTAFILHQKGTTRFTYMGLTFLTLVQIGLISNIWSHVKTRPMSIFLSLVQTGSVYRFGFTFKADLCLLFWVFVEICVHFWNTCKLDLCLPFWAFRSNFTYVYFLLSCKLDLCLPFWALVQTWPMCTFWILYKSDLCLPV